MYSPSDHLLAPRRGTCLGHVMRIEPVDVAWDSSLLLKTVRMVWWMAVRCSRVRTSVMTSAGEVPLEVYSSRSCDIISGVKCSDNDVGSMGVGPGAAPLCWTLDLSVLGLFSGADGSSYFMLFNSTTFPSGSTSFTTKSEYLFS